MRLIDADKCPCAKCYPNVNMCCIEPCDEYRDWVDTTIYDVDKVLNNLEYASYCKSTPTFDHPYTDSIIDLNEAVDIVKRGGVK